MEKLSRWVFFFLFLFYQSQNCFPLITLTSQSSFLDISSNLPGPMAASILHGQTTLSWRVCGKVTQPKEIVKMKKNFQGHCVPDVLTGSSTFFLGTMFSAQVAIFRQCRRAYDWTTGILGNYKAINVEPKNEFRIYLTHWPSKC